MTPHSDLARIQASIREMDMYSFCRLMQRATIGGCESHRDQNAVRNILKKGGGTAFGGALPIGGPENREPAPFRGGSVSEPSNLANKRVYSDQPGLSAQLLGVTLW